MPPCWRGCAVRSPICMLRSCEAEAGGGPLIADEDERQAVLAKSAEEQAMVAGIERERLEKKAAIRAATTVEDVKTAGLIEIGKGA